MRPIVPTIALLLSTAAPVLAAAPLPGANGQVVAPDGKPLADVFVQQQGAIASAITDQAGRYRLKLDPGGEPVLVFSSAGYLSQVVPSSGAQRVTLRPIPTYVPMFQPVPSEHVPVTDQRFDTELGLSYRLRDQFTTASGRTVTGLANNELAGEARYRVRDVVLGLSGFRSRVPVAIAGLTPQPNPAPAIETSQWNVSAGYVLPLGSFELLPEVFYSNYYVSPSNNGTPWTGTPLDYAQTRQSSNLLGFLPLGVGLDAGTRWGDWELFVHGRYVPDYATTLSGAPYALNDVAWGNTGATLGYNLFPGLRLDFDYSRQFSWGTNFGEAANVYGIGLSYHPMRVAP